MKKTILFGVIFLLTINFASALSSSTESLYAGDSIFFEGYNVFLSISMNGEKILVQVDNNPYFIDLGLTAQEFESYRGQGNTDILYDPKPSIQHEDLIVKLKRTCFDVDEKTSDCKKEARVNDITKLIDPSFELELEFKEPKVKVTREYSNKNVVYGEKITLTVTVKNEGDVDLEEFKYEETYPNAIEVVPGSNTIKDGQKITYSIPKLKKGEVITFKYKIFVKDTLEYSLKGKYSYKYRNEIFEEFTGNSIINLIEILTPEVKFSSDKIEPGKQLDLIVKIKNNIDQKVTFKFELDIPLQIKNTDGIKKEGDKYFIEGTIQGKEIINKKMSVVPQTEKVYEVSGILNSNYIIDNPTQHTTDTLDATYDYEGCIFCINLIPEDTSLLETEHTTLEAHMVRNDNVIISDIKASVTGKTQEGDLFDNWKFNASSLDAIYMNKYLNFILPSIEKTQNIEFEVAANYTIKYLNGTTTKENLKSKSTAKLYKLEDAIEITQTLSPSSVKQNQVTTVKVNVKNNLDSRGFRHIYAFDDTPQDFIYKEIITDTYFNLEPLEKKQIYSYELKAPFFVNKSSSFVKTTLLFEDFNLTKNNDISGNVDIQEPKLDINVDSQDESSLGAITRVGFRIRNTGNLDINKLTLFFPVSETLELFNSELTYSSTLLEPGEQIELYKDYRVRSLGEVVVNNAIVIYEDIYGNEFIIESRNQTTQANSGSIACYVTSKKEINNDVPITNNKIPLKIVFKNNCDKSTSINTNIGNIEVPANSEKTLNYEEIHINNSEEIKPTQYTYSYENRAYSTITNNIPKREMSVNEQIDKVDENNTNKEEEVSEGIITITKPKKEEFSFNFLKQIGTVGFVAILIFGLMFIVLNFKGSKNDKTSEKSESMLQKPYKPEHLTKTQEADLTKTEIKPKIVINEAPEVGGDLNEVKNYISKSKLQGLTNDAIEANLTKKGWDETLIEVFLK